MLGFSANIFWDKKRQLFLFFRSGTGCAWRASIANTNWEARPTTFLASCRGRRSLSMSWQKSNSLIRQIVRYLYHVIMFFFHINWSASLALVFCFKVAGIVYPWIRLSNPWIHIESWKMNLDLVCIVDHESGFSLYRGSQIRTWKDSFQVVDHRSSQFSKDLTWFQESNKSSWIFTTIVWNKFHTLKRTYLRFLANSR
jgi:hypothetical protein